MQLLGSRLFNHLVNTECVLGGKEIDSHGWPSEQ